MTLPQIPTANDFATPAIDALVGRRPRALSRIGNLRPRYSNVVEGWRAQARIERAHIADEVAATRLPLAEDRALRELARSEFFADVVEEPSKAWGIISMQRVVENAQSSPTGNFTSGRLPAGFRVRKRPRPDPVA